MMTILASLALIFGSISSLANIPQAVKIFRRKSAKDVSILTYSMLLPGAIIWVLYGIEIGNMPVIIVNSISSANMMVVIYGWFLYGR